MGTDEPEMLFGIENLVYFHERFCNDMEKSIQSGKIIYFHRFIGIVEELLWIHSQICYALKSRDEVEQERLEKSMARLNSCIQKVFDEGVVVYGDVINAEEA